MIWRQKSKYCMVCSEYTIAKSIVKNKPKYSLFKEGKLLATFSSFELAKLAAGKNHEKNL